MIKSKIKEFATNHEMIGFYLKKFLFAYFSFLSLFISDKYFLYIQYFLRTGKPLSLKSPKLYNEKIQWLKLYYRNPLLNRCVDKWEVRKHVREKGLEDILIDASGPYDSVDEINFCELPSEFILKLTNGSGFNIICLDKKTFDIKKAKNRFKGWTGLNFYHARREWAYKDVKNRIICERLIRTADGMLPSDYRFFCFDGEVKFVAVDLDSVVDGKKTSQYFRHLFTPEWEELDVSIQYPKKAGFKIPPPPNLRKMLEISAILAEGFPAVRIDLYDTGDHIYFGEMTFYHASGYQKITPESYEEKMGDWLNLPF